MSLFVENTHWFMNGYFVCNLLSNCSEKVCVYVCVNDKTSVETC